MLDPSIWDDGSGISGIDPGHGSSAVVGIKIMHYRAPSLRHAEIPLPPKAAPRCG